MRFPTFLCALFCVLCLASAWALPHTARAAEVINLNDAGAGSLRQAVTDTAGGGEVTFNAGLTGTINLASEIAFNKGLTITGPGSGVITVKAASTSRIFNVTSGTFIVKDLTLQGGGGTVSGDGGLIRCLDELIIRYCILKNGKASLDGGAVYLSVGTLQCYNNTFQDNLAGGYGGALHQENSTWFSMGSCQFTGNTAATDGGAVDLDTVTNGSINGCTLSNNHATGGNGGGIAVNLGNLTMDACSVLGNDAAGQGGGIYASGGCALYLHSGSHITANVAGGAGGGVFSMSGTVRIEDSALEENVASGNYNGAGGAGLAQINASSGWSLIIRKSTISSNRALAALAGGLYSTSDAEITDCNIDWNQSTGNGAGMYYAGEILVMNRCTFSRNVSGGEGGGLCLPNISSFAIQLEQCSFLYNQAETNGGGIESGRTTYLYACTLSENIAGHDINTGDGGGIHVTSYGYLQARGSIIAKNHDQAAGGTQNNDCLSAGGSSGSYTLLGAGEGCSGIADGANGNLVGTNVARLDPKFMDPGFYGGLTQVLPLLPTSPARDANVACLGRGSVILTSDQRGMPRPCGAECDMGAVEMAGGYSGTDLLLFLAD